MADAKTEKPKAEPPPPPKPPEPPRNVAKEAEAKIASMKTGRDPFRAIRYTAVFLKGTVSDTLHYFVQYARTGTKWGAAIGAIAFIAATAGTGVTAFVVCMGSGFLAGAAIGATKGVSSGGLNAVARIARGERYADDLVERAKVQKSAGRDNRRDRALERRQRDLQRESDDAANVQYLDAREREINEDYKTYWSSNHGHSQSSSWADRVSAATNYDKGMGY